MTSSAPSLEHLASARASAALLVRHAPLGDDRGAGGRKPLGGDLRASCRSPSAKGRAAASTPRRPCGRGKARLRTSGRLAPRASASSRAAAADRERNDLHGRDHLAGDHRLVGRQRREGDRFVDAVERVDRRPCRRPARRRFRANRLARPVKARSTCTPSPATACGDLGRGHVLGNIARLEPRHHDVPDAGGLERSGLDAGRSACPS